jgi:hypothetical protein
VFTECAFRFATSRERPSSEKWGKIMILNLNSSKFVFFAVMIAMPSLNAFADPTPTPTPQPKLEKAAAESEEKKPGEAPTPENVDELITNNNLRALSGSKSKWSIASEFNYNGGTISSPFSQDRPDISGASGTTTKADLDGSISVKYNLSTKSALLAGIGVRWIAPFSTGNIKNYDGDAFDFINPYLTYQYIYKWWGIQSVLQASFMEWTQSDQTALGYGQQVSIDQENMYEIGETHISIGASINVQYQWFNKSGAYGNPSDQANYISDLGMVQSQYLFTVAPELEYQISDKVNFRTLVNLWTYEHYKVAPQTLIHDVVYESVGVGVSITRDIFVYPNVQFLPGNIGSQLTNVGVTATINLF